MSEQTNQNQEVQIQVPPDVARGVYANQLLVAHTQEEFVMDFILTLRGQIRWADLNPVRGHEQAGARPVLIVSHDVFNARSGTVIAIALTSKPQRAKFPLTLELKSTELPKQSWVKISQVRTLSIDRIGKSLGTISAEDLIQVIEGLNEIIGA